MMIAQILNTPSKSKKQIIANKVTTYFFDSLSALITRTLIHVSVSILENFSFSKTHTSRD